MICGFLFQVHTSCKESLVTKCPLGLCKVSVIPPTALNSIDSDGGCSILAVFTCLFSMLPFLLALEMGVLTVLKHGQQEARLSYGMGRGILGIAIGLKA